MKKILAVVLTIALTFALSVSFTACGNDPEGTLIVGYTLYAPMNYFDDDNNFVGFDTELAIEVGKLINKKVEFVEINWDNKVLSLNGKEIDAVWNGMTITDDLKKVMAITEPYLENKQVIVCQKSVSDQYTTQTSLKNAKEIFVEAGSAGEKTARAIEGANVLTVTAQKDTLLEVASSADKVAVIDITMAKVLTGEGTSYQNLTYVDVDFEVEQFGIGFRLEDVELKNSVENAIKTLKQNGTFDSLMAKYFS